MAKPTPRLNSLVEQAASGLVLAIVLLYTFALFLAVPYIGFYWNTFNNQVEDVYTAGGLQPGDQIISLGAIKLDDYRADLRLELLTDVQPGDKVELVIRRGAVEWIIPGFNYAELLNRLSGQWWLALMFWAVGHIALIALRPQDTRRRLFIAFNFITAIWLSASSVSQSHIWASPFVLRSAMWLSVPIYWHLHWELPTSLRRLPRIVWLAIYLPAIILAAVEWFQILPVNFYAIGFLLAVAGSLVLIVVRLLARPAERRDIIPLVIVATLAFGLPALLIASLMSGQALRILLTTLIALPILPVSYFVAASRRRLGNLEVRANRIISLFFFLFLLNIALIIVVALLEPVFHFAGDDFFVAVGAAAIAALASIFVFPRFERFIEQRFLGMPLPPTKLLETYAERITISPDDRALIALLKDNIIPSLLVRQSALLRLDDGATARPIYVQGVDETQLPAAGHLPALIAEAGHYRLPDSTTPPAWVRVSLVLSIEKRPIGLWLLGQRDPDDYYSQQEIEVLQALAHQTAIALVNILQAERLRAFYQADIEANETQRADLARELHDNLLNQMAALKNSIDEQNAPPHFFERFDTLIANARHTISGLRPAMLNYGLYIALEALVDDLRERYEDGPNFSFEVSADGTRYSPHMELHVYRITQQACDNAIKHAQPKSITIIGRLSPALIDLTIEDDGRGFEAGPGFDLNDLTAHKHFGLMGMYERATLIGADIQFLSAPGNGTKVSIRWKRDGH
mgnify:CR=1 FL=1